VVKTSRFIEDSRINISPADNMHPGRGIAMAIPKEKVRILKKITIIY
jgi:hypothetical protein